MKRKRFATVRDEITQKKKGARTSASRPCSYSVSLTSSTRSKKHSIVRKSNNLHSLPLAPL